MTELVLGVATGFWLGILTSISPCPLATNIAAISYIGRKVSSTRQVLLAGVLYTLGRVISYVALACVLLYTALSMPRVSIMLQKYGHLALGPILILVGMLLLGLIQINLGGKGISPQFQKRIDSLGLLGAMVLGVVFALAFCPTSAALFFGNLMSSLQVRSALLVPGVYGIGTGLPVLVFALLIAFSAQSVGKAYNVLTAMERWARWVTGSVFILIGIWFTLRYVFEVF